MDRNSFDSISSVILLVVALGMAGVFLYDRWQANAPLPTVVIDGWEEFNESGVRMGLEEAPLVITEFMDFTCPFCRDLAPVTDSLLSAYPRKVAIVVQHFPLPNREMSLPAAMAAECAGEQGQFKAMYHVLFANMDSIGRWDWADFAMEAGVSDIRAFETCIERPAEEFERIARGQEIGVETGVFATPTVWVNGQVVEARTVREFEDLGQQLGVPLDSDRR